MTIFVEKLAKNQDKKSGKKNLKKGTNNHQQSNEKTFKPCEQSEFTVFIFNTILINSHFIDSHKFGQFLE
jgi:hypothetical protein